MSEQLVLLLSDYVLSAIKGTNTDLLPNVLKLYAKPGGQVIADVTYGKGTFWRNVDTSVYDFLPTDLAEGVDCRALPYEDSSIDVLVLDPPYIYNPKDTVKASISEPYRVNTTGLGLTTVAAVVALYRDSLVEAARVLRPDGFAFVKCQDQIESGKQRWVHIDVKLAAKNLGFVAEDLFVLVQNSIPARRWPQQYHARKNHSYLWVFRKK